MRKVEIYRGLTPNGVAIINGEHNYIELWQKKLVHMLFNILMLAITKLKMSNIHLMAQRLR